MIPRKLHSGLTAKTVGITFLIAVMVVSATIFTSRTFGRLHELVDNLTNTRMEQLMTSVRLVQQTESLISLGLMLAGAENHDERRAALIDLTDRTTWIDHLTAELAKSGSDAQLLREITAAEKQLSRNITVLNGLVRKRIEHQASARELADIHALSSQNKDLAGRLSVLMGYISATLRSQMESQSKQLAVEIELHQRNLILLTVVLLVSAVLSGIYFERRVVSRILRMQRAVMKDDVAPADLDVGGSDEITQLSKTIGSYVERIQAQEARMTKINDELAFLAEHDPLTELANRRHLYAAAKGLLAHSRLPICVALGDIDHFKPINDRYGHAIGDRTLVHIAEQMRNGLRENDILSRFGGEEFAVVLPVHSLADAEVIFNMIRQEVENHPVRLDNGDSITVTISFGLALIEDLPLPAAPDEERIHALLNGALRAADLALYEAKQTGRNRVSLSETPLVSTLM